MTDHLPGLEIGTAFVHMEVGPADVGARDAHQHVGRPFDLGIGDLFDANVARSPVNECFHCCTSCSEKAYGWSWLEARPSLQKLPFLFLHVIQNLSPSGPGMGRIWLAKAGGAVTWIPRHPSLVSLTQKSTGHCGPRLPQKSFDLIALGALPTRQERRRKQCGPAEQLEVRSDDIGELLRHPQVCLAQLGRLPG